jgi:hypothetical protein
MAEEQSTSILLERISQLDNPRVHFEEPEKHLRQFVWVMRSYFEGSMGPRGSAVIGAIEADELVSSSQLVSMISSDDAPIAEGPLSRTEQHWIPTNRNSSTPDAARIPAVTRFVRPGLQLDARPSAHHLRGGGLYTSTPATVGKGMWELYLNMFPSQMTPRPWCVWAIAVRDDPVIEIASASDWVRFMERFGRKEDDGLVYPVWRDAANDFAGLHVTARAVAAAQGFSFRTRVGLTAAPFWDVEQTIWFRWAFESSHLVRRYE